MITANPPKQIIPVMPSVETNSEISQGSSEATETTAARNHYKRMKIQKQRAEGKQFVGRFTVSALGILSTAEISFKLRSESLIKPVCVFPKVEFE